MKKMFCLLFVVLIANSSYATLERKNCDEVAYVIVDAIEEAFGCYELAEDYNDAVAEAKKFCENGAAD